MRLLFVLDSFGSGGAQRQMVTLAHGLLARGHDIEFFIYHPDIRHLAHEVEARGIRVHAYAKRSRFSLSVINKLRKLIAIGEYNGILSYLSTPNFYSEVAALGRQVPLVVSERSAYPDQLSPATRVLQNCHRVADIIAVNSHHQHARMCSEFPWMRPKVVTITNGVDLSRFKPRDQPNSGEASDKLRLIAVGTVVPNKNVVGLARGAIEYCLRFGRKLSVSWAGKSLPTEDSRRTRSEVDIIVSTSPLLEWKWLGERVDIPELIPEHDALVHPSFVEGFPNAICEALACGVPVLASDIGDHSFLINEGESGFLFDPYSIEAVVDAIARFDAVSMPRRRQMRRSARLVAERELGLNVFVKRYEIMFSVLGRAGGRGRKRQVNLADQVRRGWSE